MPEFGGVGVGLAGVVALGEVFEGGGGAEGAGVWADVEDDEGFAFAAEEDGGAGGFDVGFEGEDPGAGLVLAVFSEGAGELAAVFDEGLGVCRGGEGGAEGECAGVVCEEVEVGCAGGGIGDEGAGDGGGADAEGGDGAAGGEVEGGGAPFGGGAEPFEVELGGGFGFSGEGGDGLAEGFEGVLLGKRVEGCGLEEGSGGDGGVEIGLEVAAEVGVGGLIEEEPGEAGVAVGNGVGPIGGLGEGEGFGWGEGPRGGGEEKEEGDEACGGCHLGG